MIGPLTGRRSNGRATTGDSSVRVVADVAADQSPGHVTFVPVGGDCPGPVVDASFRIPGRSWIPVFLRMNVTTCEGILFALTSILSHGL